MDPQVGEVTRLLQKWRTGDRDAENQLFKLVMPDLRRLARCYTSRERPDQILQPSALVNRCVPLGGTQPDLRFCVPNNETAIVTEKVATPILTLCLFL